MIFARPNHQLSKTPIVRSEYVYTIFDYLKTCDWHFSESHSRGSISVVGVYSEDVRKRRKLYSDWILSTLWDRKTETEIEQVKKALFCDRLIIPKPKSHWNTNTFLFPSGYGYEFACWSKLFIGSNLEYLKRNKLLCKYAYCFAVFVGCSIEHNYLSIKLTSQMSSHLTIQRSSIHYNIWFAATVIVSRKSAAFVNK